MPFKQTCIFSTHSVCTKCENDYAFAETKPQLIISPYVFWGLGCEVFKLRYGWRSKKFWIRWSNHAIWL